MAIVDRKVFDEVIRALLVVVGTVLIGLTTPKPNNFVTEMALMKVGRCDSFPFFVLVFTSHHNRLRIRI